MSFTSVLQKKSSWITDFRGTETAILVPSIPRHPKTVQPGERTKARCHDTKKKVSSLLLIKQFGAAVLINTQDVRGLLRGVAEWDPEEWLADCMDKGPVLFFSLVRRATHFFSFDIGYDRKWTIV